MKLTNLLSALLMFLVAIFASSCVIVADDGHYETQCYDDCEDIEVCERVCDDWECWDSCWIETSCDEICEDVYVVEEVEVDEVEVQENDAEEDDEEVSDEEIDAIECYSTSDCSEGEFCESNKCYTRR